MSEALDAALAEYDQATERIRTRQPKPNPITCPMCQRTYEFEWDGDEWWPGSAEWWSNDQHPFLCRRHCWLDAEGYVYDRGQGRYVKSGEAAL